MKTAVEWLVSEVAKNGLSMKHQQYLEIIEKALEMEKEQLIDFLIEVMKKGLEYENEEEWDDEYVPLIKERAVEYYNETFKQQEQ